MSSRLPTIAHVDAERGFGGGQVQVLHLLEGLRARGWVNVLICPPGSALESRARARDFRVLTRPMRNALDLPAVWGLARDLRVSAAALAHFHTSRAHWLGGLAARLADVPALVTRRMDRRVARTLRSRLLYGGLVRRSVAISAAVERRLAAGGVPSAERVCIVDAVDPRALRPRRPRAELRAELGAAPGDRVILALGSLTELKGHDLAIRALARLVGEGLPARLWIAGQGGRRQALEALVRELDLGARVRLLGLRDDVPDLLAACDLFVMPSHSEGLGVAALEAMACGVPVVATAVGGLAETVVDERTGLSVERPDAGLLADALGRLLRNPELAARLGAAGAARVTERYHVDSMCAAYDALYREILSQAGRAVEVQRA